MSIKCKYHCIKTEFQKIVNLLDTTSDGKDLSRFVTKKWIEVHDQSEKSYGVNKEIRIKTSISRSDLCDFSVAYIVVKGDITPEGDNDANKQNKNLAFKNNAPFINCVPQINGIQIDNAEDLDVVIPMYNLLEYSKNYKKQHLVCGIIIDMNQLILFQLILNLLSTKQILYEKHHKIMIH